MTSAGVTGRPAAAEPRPRPTLANFWHPVAISSEVTEQPKQFELLGELIVLFRDSRGVAAFEDLCIHRGAALSLGWVADGRLTCAYHGWEYDRTGACVKIPSLPEGATIPRKARAVTYRTAERYGWLGGRRNEPGAPLPRWPADEWDDPDFRGCLSSVHVWRASAGRVIEN